MVVLIFWKRFTAQINGGGSGESMTDALPFKVNISDLLLKIFVIVCLRNEIFVIFVQLIGKFFLGSMINIKALGSLRLLGWLVN